MPISDVSVGGKITATTQNDIIAAVNAAAMRVVTPSTVDKTGTDASIGTDGVVTYTSCTVVSLNDVFSSTYRGYRIVFASSGTASTAQFNLRSSGTDNTSSVYDRTEIVGRNGSVTSSTNAGGTSWTIIGFSNVVYLGDIDVMNPAYAVPTAAFSRGGTHANPAVSSTANGLVQNYLTHRTSAAYDGFTLTFSAAQSGTVRVFGFY